jgi:hypothetical protein
VCASWMRVFRLRVPDPYHSLVHDCDRRHDVCTNNVPWQAQSVASTSTCDGYDLFDFPLPVSYDHYSCNYSPALLWEHRVSVTSTVFAHCINVLPFPRLTHSPWCWIPDASREASRLKIASQYAYFWLAAAVSFVLYGIIVVNWLREATAKRDRRLHREAISMAW